MISDARLIEVLKPVAPSILGADARAIAGLSRSKQEYAGLDHQPAAAAIAGKRRAVVATDMRRVMEQDGWVLNEEHHPSGAYEWFKEDVAVRLSKTTPQSRKEEAAALLGVQVSLFHTTADPAVRRDTVLIRLMGNPFDGPWVDVMRLGNDGQKTYAIRLQAIAKASTEQLPSTGQPAEPGIALPDVALPKLRRTDDSG